MSRSRPLRAAPRGRRDAERRALELAREQTVEIPEGVVVAGARSGVGGASSSRVDRRPGVAARSPIRSPPSATTCRSSLNVLWGNVSLQRDVRLVARRLAA
jgi:hypothetical protein